MLMRDFEIYFRGEILPAEGGDPKDAVRRTRKAVNSDFPENIKGGKWPKPVTVLVREYPLLVKKSEPTDWFEVTA